MQTPAICGQIFCMQPDLVLVGLLKLCSTVLGRGLSDVLLESSVER